MKSLEQESENQKNHAEKSVNHNSKSHPDRFIRDPPMNPYHIIDQEAHLLDEIKDIRDEMNMLRILVEAQDNVWKQAFILDNPSDSSSWNTKSNGTPLTVVSVFMATPVGSGSPSLTSDLLMLWTEILSRIS